MSSRDRVWVYFSGGGLKSAMASLGGLYFLADLGSWNKVDRVASISGGSLTNGALALHEPAVADDAAIRPFARKAFDRQTQHGWVQHYLRTVGTVVLTAVVGVLLGWLLFDVLDWHGWARAPQISLSVLIMVALVKYVVRQYIRDRAGFIIGARKRQAGPRNPTFAKVLNPKLQIFDTANNVSGLPAYLATAGPTGRLVHDRTDETNAVEYFEAGRLRFLDAVYAGGVWPGIGIPGRKKLQKINNATTPVRWRNLAPGVAPYRYGYSPVGSTPDPANTERFAKSDAGQLGTIAGSLDPPIHRVLSRGTMHEMGDHFGLAAVPPAHQDVLRYIVDGGSYLKRTNYWLQAIPPLTVLFTTIRAIKMGNAGLTSLERVLADGRDYIWYLPTTGHDRVFRLPFAPGVQIAWDAAQPLEDGLGGPILQRKLRLGRTKWFDPPPNLTHPIPEWARVVQLIIDLKAEADRVSYFTGYKTFSTGAAASGLAAGFVEAYSVGYNEQPLRDLLRKLETDLLRRGALDRAMRGRDTYLRWPELAGAGSTPALSHRGKPTLGARRNSLAAFQAASADGYRVFEVDVYKINNNQLACIHTLPGGWVRKGWRFKRARNMSLADLNTFLGGGVDDLATMVTWFERNQPGEVTWNIEAKDRGTARLLISSYLGANWTALAPVVPPLPAIPPLPPIISTGWKYRLLREVRMNNPRELTAAGKREMWRLFRRRKPAPHVAVLQLPRTALGFSIAWFWKRMAKNAREQGIQIHWWRVKRLKQVRQILDDPDAQHDPGNGTGPGPIDGIIADDHDMLRTERMTRGIWP